FRRVRVYTLILSPRKAGTLTIKPGRLIAKGKTYETGPIKVKVLQASQAPRRPAPQPQPQQPPRPANPFGLIDSFPDDPDQLLEQFFGGGVGHDRPTSDSDIYLRNHVNKRQAWLGEQITLSTYLFSRVDISGVDGMQMPKLDGFWAEDIETPSQISGELKMIDGEPYRVFLLRKRALFPIKSGKLTIDPVEVDVTTGFSLVFSGRKVHRASQPVTIEVLPLPPGAPAGFEAANVGQWRLKAEATPTRVQLGQPITLRVTLEGSGNVRNVAVPKLPPINGFKSYDPTTSEKISTAKGRYGGRRTLEYLLMPTQTGTFEIPPLVFSYFDPATRDYRQAASEPIRVEVEAGQMAAGGQTGAHAAAGPADSDHAVNLLAGSGLRPLRYKGELSRPTVPLYRKPFFLPVAASPLVLWIGLTAFGLLRSAVRQQDEGARKRKAGARTRRRLRTAKGLMKAGKPDAFYAEVSRALNDYLADKLGSPVAGLTRPELASRLHAAGAPQELVARLGAALDTCDAGRFAPGATEGSTMKRVHTEALEVMDALEAIRLRPADGGEERR
ncbi:MAG: BatD family protein, partial [Myxococcales bacterium]